MNQAEPTADAGQTTEPPMLRLLLIAAALLVAISCGCSRLRLPAIDPSGSCLFTPLPTTTGLALPGMGGDGCFGCLNKPKFGFPTPAFVEPPAPPPCATPADSSIALGQTNEPCVPSAPCAGSCAVGPRAVLLGSEVDATCRCCLPDRGKRGCILLSPQRIVAPVGGEVVLLSGICGDDGYLQMNEKLEWMLAPDSVGNFIQVGDDEPGLVGRLAGSKVRPEKKDPSYAIGITSTKRTLITRGNVDPRDDVRLEKGQTWISLSSPSEGVSHVTVLAPESECWDQRKSTATIYWVDATAQFPGPEIVPAGTPVDLTTRVTRSEGTLPARGWKVRYEIQQPELAGFAGTNGSSVVEATVDDSGNATVTLVPIAGTSGTTGVDMQVIRPGGVTDNVPTLTLGQGQTFVTWSSPKLELRAGAPAVASFDTPYQVVANLRNPGNQPATNVRVDVQTPPGTRIVGADSFARVLPNGVTWEIGTLPPQTQLDLFLDLASQSPVDLAFVARGDGLVTEDSVRVDIFRPSLTLDVAPVQERVEAGQPVTFNIDVTNNGDRPLSNAYVTATGDSSIIHESGGTSVRDNKDTPLQPGETWRKEVIFTPTQTGRRCIVIEAFADGGQRARQEACTLAINPIPETPKLTVDINAQARVAAGDTPLVRGTIVNEGRGNATNVTVNMVFEAQLQLIEATEGAGEQRIGQRIVTWTVPNVAPGQTVVLEGRFTALAPTPQTRISMTAESSEGARASDDVVLEIVGGSSPVAPPRTPGLPPAGPAPEIPSGPAPLQGAPQTAPPNVPPPQAGPTRSGRLQTILIQRDPTVRVNDPIRYRIRVVNDSYVRDGQVGIEFALPDGVELVRVVPLTNPELSDRRINAGIVSLPYIPVLEAGDSTEFELVLRSNQAQQFNLNVGVRSVNQPDGYVESVTTTVVP